MRTSSVASSIITIIVLILSIQAYQMAHAQTEVQIESKALTYIMNVLPFNMSHYNITVGKAYSLPSGPNDTTITQAVEIDLKSNGSTIHVVCLYVNGALHQCGVRSTGTPIADRTNVNLKDVVNRILIVHQQQTGLDSTNLLNTLNLVNDTETTKVVLGEVSLSISRFPDIIGLQTIDGIPVPVASNSSFSISFHWMLSKNGITTSQFLLSFDNGIFYNLQDDRAIQPTEDTNSTNKEQATTPTLVPIADPQENFTSQIIPPQSTNGSSEQTNQLLSKPTQKTLDTQNELVNPLLIAAVAEYITVVLLIITYKSKN